MGSSKRKNKSQGRRPKVRKKPYFQMRARAYRLHLANVATGELALFCEACGVSITN